MTDRLTLNPAQTRLLRLYVKESQELLYSDASNRLISSQIDQILNLRRALRAMGFTDKYITALATGECRYSPDDPPSEGGGQ